MRYPFKWTPAAWGLKGTSYKIAEAEYNYSGEQLEYELLRIKSSGVGENAASWAIEELKLDRKYDKISPYEYRCQMATWTASVDELPLELLLIDREFDKITSQEFDRKSLELTFKGDELALEQLHLDFKNNIISEREYTKEVAIINDTAWVYGDIKLDGKGKTFLEMEWNDAFIEGLRDKGYSGLSDEEIVDMWWTNLNLNDVEEHAVPLTTNVTPLGNGKTEIS